MLQSCNLLGRLGTVGDGPDLSHITNPNEVDGYQPTNMPMPDPQPQSKKINSLWENGSRAFFKDQRASKVGDLLTVIIDFKEEGGKYTVKGDHNINHETNYNFNTFLGLEKKIKDKVLPHTTKLPLLMDTQSNPKRSGEATEEMKNEMKFTITATVTQVLPNGNLVIWGRRENRLGGEVKDINITGIVRREDIKQNNSVSGDKIAESRISYAGRGDLTDASRVPWLNQAVRKVSPF